MITILSNSLHVDFAGFAQSFFFFKFFCTEFFSRTSIGSIGSFITVFAQVICHGLTQNDTPSEVIVIFN